MAFETYGDQVIPSGVNGTIVPCSPGAELGLRVRALQLQDPTVLVPVSGIAAPFVRHIERTLAQAIQDTMAPQDAQCLLATDTSFIFEEVTRRFPAYAEQLQTYADLLPGLSSRVLESESIGRILQAFGVISSEADLEAGIAAVAEKMNPAATVLIELNSTLNRWGRNAAAPLHALGMFDNLGSFAAQLPSAFFLDDPHAADLDRVTLHFLAHMAALRFATSISTVKWVTKVETERNIRSLQASQVLTSLASVLSATAAIPTLARIHSLVAFATSDLAVDAMKDEDGIRLRKLLIEKYAVLDGVDLFELGKEFHSFFTAKTIKVAGQTFQQYNMPPHLFKQLYTMLTGLPPRQPEDRDAIPSFAVTDRGIWAILKPADALAVKSELFQVAFVSTRSASLAAVDAIVKTSRAAIELAIRLIDDFMRSTLVTNLPGGLNALKAGGALLTKGLPLARFGEFTINSPESLIPAVLSGEQNSLGSAVDPAILKHRPLVAPVTNSIAESDIAALAGMYGSGLENRLVNIGAPKVRYEREPLPVVSFIIKGNERARSGNWPLRESPRFYQLWSHCFSPQHRHPARTLDIPALTGLIQDLDGYAALNVIRRDVSASMRQVEITTTGKPPITQWVSRVATAFSRVGVLISISKAGKTNGFSGDPKGMAAAVIEQLTGQTTPADVKLRIARPTTGYSRYPGRVPQLWPTDGKTLSDWARYTSASAVESVLVEMSQDGSWWFLPFTHVPPPLPFDLASLYFALSKACDPDDADPSRGHLSAYRIYGRPGARAMDRTERLLRRSNPPSHVSPTHNAPWENVVPMYIGAGQEVQLSDWWSANGIIVLASDVRDSFPSALRAGQPRGTEMHLMLERTENGIPRFKASVPTGTIIMSTDPATPVAESTIAPQAASKIATLESLDWVAGYSDPSKVTSAEII